MARININVGTNANDGTGDDLRTAMQKINTNFAELYGADDVVNTVISDTAPKLGGNLDINGWDITSSRSNENIRISPNGTGDLVVTSDIVPSGDNTQELGSNSKRWKEVHIGPGSLSFWDIVLNTRTQIEKAQADLLKAIDDTGFSGSTASATKAIIDTGFDANTAGRLQSADDAGFFAGSDGSTNSLFITSGLSNADVVVIPNGSGVCVIDQLEIDGAELTPTTSNTDIVFTPTGTGVVQVDEIEIDGTEITPVNPNTYIKLTPTGTGTVEVNGSVTYLADASFNKSSLFFKDNIGVNRILTQLTNNTYTQLVSNTNETFTAFEYLASNYAGSKITLWISSASGNVYTNEFVLANSSSAVTIQAGTAATIGTSPVSSVTADHNSGLIRLRVTTINTLPAATVYKYTVQVQLFTSY